MRERDKLTLTEITALVPVEFFSGIGFVSIFADRFFSIRIFKKSLQAKKYLKVGQKDEGTKT